MAEYKAYGGLALRIVIGIMMLALFLAGGANAATHTVCPGGCTYSSIQGAINAARSGDTVEVENGTYFENVFVTKQLTLRGIGMPVVDAGGSGSAITLASDGIVIEGFTVKGATSTLEAGIKVRSNNNTIRANNANSNSLGIFLNYSNFNNITGNNISNSTNVGIKIYNTSKNNTISGNKVTNSSFGIFFVYAFNTTASNNIMENNSLNFGVGGNLQSHFDGNNIDTSNLANGRPIYYVKYGKNTTFDSSTRASTFYCILCNNVTLKDLEISNMDRGVYFWSTGNSRIQNVTVKDSGWGLYLRMSSNNSIRNSKFSTNNILDYFETGVSVYSSDNNTFENNTFISNNYGIELYSSNKNTIYNNYFNNTNNFIFAGTTGNTWNTTLKPGKNIVGGPYLGGNFWDNPSGTGFSQTCPDGNGNKICDLQNILSVNNIDHLPLIFNMTTPTIGPVHNINKGANYTTIQAAINDSNPGDEIHVDSGTYYENVNVSKKLILRGIEMPVVNAGGNGSAITLAADGIILEGFTATNATIGIIVTSKNNMLIANNASNNRGHLSYGIYLYSSSNNTLIGNNANSNGGYSQFDHVWSASGEGYGIYLSFSNNNNLGGNNANSNWGEFFDGPGQSHGYGILLSYSSNNTLSGNNANSNSGFGWGSGCTSYGYGILLSSSSNNTLSDNNANFNSGSGSGSYGGFGYGYGILLSSSSNNILSGNNANSNAGWGSGGWDLHYGAGYGIYLSSSSNNTLRGNNASSSSGSNDGYGIMLSNSNKSVLKNNIIEGNKYNFGLEGSSFLDFDNQIDKTNLVDGRPVYYIRDTKDTIYDSDTNAGTFYCINCINVTLKNLELLNNINGIFFLNTTKARIQNVTASYNGHGIFVSSSSNLTLIGNNASSNHEHGYEGGTGISLSSSNNITLISNNANSNFGGYYRSTGISLFSSNNITMIRNNANYNYGGYEGGTGIFLSSSNNNTLSGNNASSNSGGGPTLGPGYGYGILLSSSSNNTLSGNNVSNNENEHLSYYDRGAGISMSDSSNNVIYNNIFNNTENVQIVNSIINTWNTTRQFETNIIAGTSLGGNFWATPNDTGFSQQCEDSNGDGICDSTYALDSTNIDYLPLAKREPIHNINKGTNYTTIQAAINDASLGDEIHVDSGTYYENVNVTKQLILRGESNLTTIIEGNGGGNVVEVKANGVVLDGFRIRNGSNGIFVNSSNNVFSNNVIMEMHGVQGEDYVGTGGMSSGIYLFDSTNNSVTGNIISNISGGTGGNRRNGGLSSGLYLSFSINSTIEGNTIINITGGAGGMYGADQEGSGIYLDNNSYQNIIDPTNTVDSDPIIYLYDADGAIIENHVLTANSNPTNLGKIVLINSSNSIIRNNTISNMKVGHSLGINSGIYISDSTNIELTGNTVSNITGGTGGSGVWDYAFYVGGTGGMSSGIYLISSSNSIIAENTITNITGGAGEMVLNTGTGGSGGLSSGIYMSDSQNNTLKGNDINYLKGGFGGQKQYIPGSGGSGGCSSGIYLSGSLSNTIAGNTISYLTGGIGAVGIYDMGAGGQGGSGGSSSGVSLSDSQNNTITGNTISNITGTGGTEGYGPGRGGGGGDSSGIYLSVSPNNTLAGNKIDSLKGGDGRNGHFDVGGSGGHSSGILLYSSPDNLIADNAISCLRGGSGATSEYRAGSGGNSIGIYLSGSTNSNLTGNAISDTVGGTGESSYDYSRYHNGSNGLSAGLYLSTSDNNTLGKNNVTLSNDYGIYLISASNNTLYSNNVSNNGGTGIFLTSIYEYWNNTYLKPSSNNTISNNIMSNNSYGFNLFASGKNTLLGNNASNNNYGISLDSSSNNTIYNNIFNNTINIQFTGLNLDTWNTTKQPGTNIIGGSHLGGNFWANPDGTGFSQTCVDTERDGICDSPYILDANNTDYLPLSMNFTSDSTMAEMFGVNNSTGAPNTFVLVPVNITNSQNGPIAGIVFDISFDPGIINLTKIRVQRGSLTSSWDSPGFNPDNGRISLVYGGAGTEIPDGSSGTVVILNFSVVGASGSKSAINISRIQLSDPDGIMGTAPSMNGTFSVSLKGDLNDNGEPADAGDLVLMKRASIGEIPADFRYDMNNNGELADAGDLVLMKRASIGEIILSMSLQGALSSTIQPNATDFGVNDVTGNPDTYVLVPVNITNSQNGPIAGIIFDISFDPGIINLTNMHVQRGDLISTWDSPSFNPINGRISLVYGGAGTEIPDDATGSVVILNFTVIGAVGSKSAINISRIQLSDPDGIMGTAPSRNGTFSVIQLSDNIPPVAVCGPDNLKCENVGAPVQFNGSASYDPDGAIVSYYWDFGDGTNVTDVAPKHAYSAYKRNGTGYESFIANLTVADNSGLTNKTSQKVFIRMAGDANGDGKVNILDASVIGLKWGGNDSCADLNNDGAVNILDASIIGLNWGKNIP